VRNVAPDPSDTKYPIPNCDWILRSGAVYHGLASGLAEVSEPNPIFRLSKMAVRLTLFKIRSGAASWTAPLCGLIGLIGSIQSNRRLKFTIQNLQFTL
jgi:hypothetical protein